MSERADLHRVLGTWLRAEAPRKAPDDLLGPVFDVTSASRPFPTWRALLSVPPMRAHSAVLVGSPTLRLTRVVVVALVIGLLAAMGALITGSRDTTLPAGSGLIAYTGGTWGWDGTPTVAGQAIFSVAPNGGEPRRLAEVPGEALPRWAWQERRLPELGEDIRLGPAVRWSPAGARIAFRLYNDKAGLYVMNGDGSSLRLVAEATGERSETTDWFNSSFAWSPDGSRIAFISPDVSSLRRFANPDAPRNGRLFVVDVENADVRELNGSASGSVAWSPDGSTIAFGRSEVPISAMVLVNADGADERSFHHAYLDNNHLGPLAWSPDGSAIAFVQTRFGPTSPDEGDYLIVVDADGGSSRDLAHWGAGCCQHGAFGGLVEWSPDGRLIATNRGWGAISVFAADGSGERLSLPGHFFDWSPDGSRLVFSGPGPSIPGAPGNRSTAIYLVDADGTDQRWLADGDYPAWSP